MDSAVIKQAADLIREARHAVALTGAGISTSSGIPDFRGNHGIWQHINPATVASLANFRANPRQFYEWFHPLLEIVLKAAPNPAHYALAVLERRNILKAIITQNFDGLHQLAGSREVYELHGHLRGATCPECERHLPLSAILPAIRHGKPPHCSCGQLIKPDVVLFDEMLPRGLYWLARHAIEHADLMIVAGTSLAVYPVSELPALGLRRQAKLVIINATETDLDEFADVVIRDNIADVLPAIVEQVTEARTVAH